MTRVWRRRALLLALVAAMTLVASGCLTFTGSKVITNGTSSGPFVVRITCEIGGDTFIEDLTFTGEGDQTSGTFELVQFVPPGIPFPADASCTITEIEQAGATSVTYQCGTPSFGTLSDGSAAGGPGMGVSRAGPPPPSPVTCTETANGLQVDVEAIPADINFTFTVINDFTPATTAPPTTAPPAAEPVAAAPAAAAPVAAQPTFTG